MLIVQLITLFLVLSILRSFIPITYKPLSWILSFLFALVFIIQLSSVIVTGEIADYRFYENFDLGDVLSVALFFGKEGILVFVALIAATFLIHYFSTYLRNTFAKKAIRLVSLLVGIAVLSTAGGIIKNAYNTLALKFAGNASFNEALSSLNIAEKDYVFKKDITAAKGKNIIVLSLESLELGYLSEKLKHLTPNLSNLAAENSLFKMKQSPAGGWTSASMYTMITGVPAFFGIHGNNVFQNSYENKLTSLSDVLQNAGYDLQYFIGKKEYTGIDDMLKTHGFTVKSEKDFETKYEAVDWGIQDTDLFIEFKKELSLKKQSKKPFALFLSTISTHFPNGVPDKRIAEKFAPQKSRLELMAAATDSLVGDLIHFLETEEMMANTVFYIYPDHLLMGNKSRVIEDFDERSLYLLTNANTDNIDKAINEDIYQVDLPKLFLNGADVQHNAQFLTDFIPLEDKNAFLRANDKNLRRLNDAALKTPNCKEGIYVNLKDEDEDEFEIRNADNLTIFESKLPEIASCSRILFDENWRPIQESKISIEDVLKAPNSAAYLDVFYSNGQLYGSLKGKYHFGNTKNDTEEIHFKKSELVDIENIAILEEKEQIIFLKSNSWFAKKPSSYRIKAFSQELERGITILCFNKTQIHEFRNFDTFGSPRDTEEFI